MTIVDVAGLLDVSVFRLTWFAVPVALSSVAPLLFALSVIIGKRGHAAMPHLVVLLLTISFWLGTVALLMSSSSVAIAYLWSKAGHLAIPLIPPAAYHFAATLLRMQRRRRIVIGSFWSLGFAFVLITLSTNAVVAGLYRYEWGYYSRFAPAGVALVMFFVAALVAIVLEFFAAEAVSSKERRSRTTPVVASLVIGFIASLDFLPAFGVPVYPFGYVAVVLAVWLSYRAIDRHGFADMTPAFAAREIVDTMADALVVCDENGVIQLVNPSVHAVLGYNEGELVGRTLDVLADPDTTIGSKVRWDAALTRGTTREQERVFRRKDGTSIDVTISAARLGSESDVAGAVLLVRDVSQRNAAHRALRNSEERYRLIYENNLAGVYRSNGDGTIIECNRAFARMLGARSTAALVGRSLREFHADRSERDQLLRMVREAGSIPSAELCLNRIDGTTVWVVETLSCALTDEEVAIQGTLVDVSDQKIAQEQIEYHAYHDVLTLLPNRTMFLDRLSTAIARGERNGSMTGVLIVDLDHFKIVNETYGHTTGDELLIVVADRLGRIVRKSDTIARAGGDEFLIMLLDNNVTGAATVASELLKSVAEPIRLSHGEVYATASIGVAMAPIDGSDAETVLKRADAALYEAKDLGRNGFHFATPEINRRAATRLSLAHNLHRALERNEFLLHYQPIVDATTRQPVAVEALIRWQSPERGLISPAEFMGVVEEGPLIVPLGQWILRTACEQAHTWRQNGLPNLRVAVNLSPRQFYDPRLLAVVSEILETTGLEPDALELEITETVAARDLELTTTVLRSLRDLGIGIALDDFGTGYSALNYLKRFPITTLKIDQSFVREMTINDGDAAIVGAILSIAGTLGLQVIAEGVETEEQYSMLHQQGCSLMQGYLFSRPLPPQDVSEFTLRRVIRRRA